MAFQQGLSGLYAASKALDVTSNNVSNSATVGFKSAQAHFADVFAASLGAGGSSAVGIGTSVGAIQQQFTQGNITSTNNPLDISINGGGFFRMSSSGSVTYSRAGQFHLDKDGYVIDDRSRRLTGYPAISGTVSTSAPTEMQLSSANIDPVATGASIGGAFQGVKASLNFDSRDPVKTDPFTFVPGPAGIGGTFNPLGYNFSTSTAIYDSLGNAHTLSMYARKETVVGAAPIATTAAVYATTAAAALPRTTPEEEIISDAAIAAAAAATTNAAAMTTSATDVTDATAAVTAAATATAAAAALPRTTPAEITASDAAIAAATAQTATANTAAATANAAAAAFGSLWSIYTSVDGTNPINVSGSPAIISFNTSGNLVKPTPPNGLLDLSIDIAGVMAGQGKSNIATSPLEFKLDFASSTQFGAAFGTNSMQQDGYTSGRLTGVSVAADGIVRGNYSNGQSKDMGQVVLANFTNPNGLASLGGNQWAETSTSGPALVGAPDSGTLGVLQSAAVEESNVDLTAELVNMITQQRNYQANAQSIKTQDQIMQTLVNLR